MNFNQIFDVGNSNRKINEPRDKFLSRVFGIFNEEIVRIWCRSEVSPYIDLGRPTIYKKNNGVAKGVTLDFTFQNKKTREIYICEMKCEIQYENFRYLELKDLAQLNHHNKDAFKRFLDLPHNPENYLAKVNDKKIDFSGAMLVWGKINSENIDDLKSKLKFHDILSLEFIINELIKSKNEEYINFLNQKNEWITYLFDSLKN